MGESHFTISPGLSHLLEQKEEEEEEYKERFIGETDQLWWGLSENEISKREEGDDRDENS
jgi:hypothetical protein